MNDRELLELVAQAEGYDTTHSMNAQRLLLDPPVIALLVQCKDGSGFCTAWNPLDKNEDAFRLMVRRGMSVRVDLVEGCTRIFNEFDGVLLRLMHFPAGPEATTRRAIVRAVALEAAR